MQTVALVGFFGGGNNGNMANTGGRGRGRPKGSRNIVSNGIGIGIGRGRGRGRGLGADGQNLGLKNTHTIHDINDLGLGHISKSQDLGLSLSDGKDAGTKMDTDYDGKQRIEEEENPSPNGSDGDFDDDERDNVLSPPNPVSQRTRQSHESFSK